MAGGRAVSEFGGEYNRNVQLWQRTIDGNTICGFSSLDLDCVRFFFFLLRLGFGFRTENNPNETIMISKDHKTRNEHVYHGHDGGSHNFTYFGKGIPPRIQCEFVTLN